MKKNQWFIPIRGNRLRKLWLMARLLFVFVFANLLHVSATAYSQNRTVTLQMKEATLEEVVQALKLQTDYGFFYNIDNAESQKVKGLDVDVREVAVEEVLDHILRKTNLTYTVVNNVVIIKSKNQVADEKKMITVKGKVVDKENIPLPGVTVKVVGTNMGIATDLDGLFSLQLPEGKYSLEFSFVGFKTVTFQAEEGKEMNITLEEEVKEMDEVVVTGYFTKSKSSYTGAVKTMKANELKAVSGTNIIAAISALTPGLNLVERSDLGSNPNHVPELLLRGMGSFSSSNNSQVNQPTIMLDGVEISMEELYDLDINEIESITVLKDASATALYGSRAANGVIVIERKKLAEGNMRVSYNFTANVQFPYLKDYDVLNAAEKLEYERLSGLYTAEQNQYGDLDLNKEQYRLDELYNKYYQEIARGVDSDWLSQPARVAFSHDHSLRLYGGASSIRYELSGRFNNTQGVMKDDYRRRYALGFKLEYHLPNRLTFSNRTTYNEVDTKDTPYGSFSNWVNQNPYDRIYDEFGNPNRNMSWNNDNPMVEAKLGNYSIDGTKTLSNTTDVRWDINEQFRITGNFNISVSEGRGESYLSPDSQEFDEEDDITKKGSLAKTDNRDVSWSGTLNVAYNKLTDNNSLISVIAGTEIRKEKSESSELKVVGFYNDELNFVGHATGYPTGQPSGSQDLSSEVGFFANANYMYNNRYYADFVYRLSGSSKFGANERFGQFWSGGLGWNLHNENFLQSDILNLLKVRGSAGYTGNVNFEPFQSVTMYQYDNTLEYLHGIGAVPRTIGNDDLKWEREFSYNIGADLSLFDQRFNATFDYYLKRTKVLVLDASIAPSTGVISGKQNIGEMENKGFEFSIDGMPIRNKDFWWQVAMTGSTNKNRILKISNALKRQNEENNNQKPSSDTPAPLAQYEVGESTTAIKVVRSAGIDPATGNEVYIKLDGSRTFEYSVDDKVVVGDTEPKFQGTVSTNLYYKGFSLYLLGTFKCGGYVYNTTRATRVEGTSGKTNVDHRAFNDRWQEVGDIALYRRITDHTIANYTDRFVEKENVFTLTSVNLGYEFPATICKKLMVRNLRLGVNLTDILRFSSVKIERGTTYLYGNGFEFTLSTTF